MSIQGLGTPQERRFSARHGRQASLMHQVKESRPHHFGAQAISSTTFGPALAVYVPPRGYLLTPPPLNIASTRPARTVARESKGRVN